MDSGCALGPTEQRRMQPLSACSVATSSVAKTGEALHAQSSTGSAGMQQEASRMTKPSMEVRNQGTTRPQHKKNNRRHGADSGASY